MWMLQFWPVGKGSPHRQIHSPCCIFMPLGIATTKQSCPPLTTPCRHLCLSLDTPPRAGTAAGGQRLTAWGTGFATKMFTSLNAACEVLKLSLRRTTWLHTCLSLRNKRKSYLMTLLGLKPRVGFSSDSRSLFMPDAAQAPPSAAHEHLHWAFCLFQRWSEE